MHRYAAWLKSGIENKDQLQVVMGGTGGLLLVPLGTPWCRGNGISSQKILRMAQK